MQVGRPANKKVKRIVVKQMMSLMEFDRRLTTTTVELADALKRLGFDDADVKKAPQKYWVARDLLQRLLMLPVSLFLFLKWVIDEYASPCYG